MSIVAAFCQLRSTDVLRVKPDRRRSTKLAVPTIDGWRLVHHTDRLPLCTVRRRRAGS